MTDTPPAVGRIVSVDGPNGCCWVQYGTQPPVRVSIADAITSGLLATVPPPVGQISR